MTVIIGVDPHKSTHTVVAIDCEERPLARLQLVADWCQTQRLLAWAEPLGTERTWVTAAKWRAWFSLRLPRGLSRWRLRGPLEASMGAVPL